MNLQIRPPVCGVGHDPLVGLKPCDMKPVTPGTPIYELMPDGEVVLCRFNGEWMPYEDLARPALPGDVIEWHVMPQNRETFRTIITVAAIIISIAYPALAPYAFAAVAAYNILLPPRAPKFDQRGGGDAVFSTSLQGNQARLNQPIWKVCGRRKISPPFAGMPYQEFVGTGVDNDQFYYAPFAVQIGECDIEAALIGGAPIATSFRDVIKQQKLEPGDPFTMAFANVETSTIVQSNTLDTAKYVGGFPACKPQRTCSFVGIDIECPRGISQSLAWRVEIQQINDFGNAVTAWSLLATETRTGDTNTPQRWSYKYAVPSAGGFRPNIRMVRTDIKNTDPNALHELTWIGLRGYLTQSAPLDPETTHYEVVMRGSAQLSQYSQRDFSLIVQAKCRTWAAGVWSAPVYTRNPFWWALDCATGDWGLGLDDDKIDIQTFADLAAIADTRQDRFDWTFSEGVDGWEALQLIVRVGRARCFRRNGILTVARDGLEELPVTAFTSRNTLPDSMVVSEVLPSLEQADGIVAEYEDHRTWLWTPIECPCPGYSATDPDNPEFNTDLPMMSNPVRRRYEGITGATHCRREGLTEAASLLYRRRTVTCKTEMEGILPAYMAPVLWQPDIVGFGQTGDVVDWDEDTLVLTLSESPAWDVDSEFYIRLRRDNGTLTLPARALPGPGPNDVLLPEAPDFTLVLDDGTRERPMFVFGPLVGSADMVKVLGILDGGKGEEGEQLYEVKGLVDDERVHLRDAPYLAGPGDDQDPIVSDPVIEDGGDLVIVNLGYHYVGAVNPEFACSSTFTLGNNGIASESHTGNAFDVSSPYTNEWMLYSVVAPATAALYEVRATYTGGYTPTIQSPGSTEAPLYPTATAPTSGDSVGSWLNLGTTRSWTMSIPSRGDLGFTAAWGANLLIEIRDVATSTVQVSTSIDLVAQNAFN